MNGDPGPAATPESPLRGKTTTRAAAIARQGASQPVSVVEIELAAAVEDAIEIGQLEGMPQPGSTVQERYAAASSRDACPGPEDETAR